MGVLPTTENGLPQLQLIEGTRIGALVPASAQACKGSVHYIVRDEDNRIIDPARVPEKPFSPDIPKILLIGLLAGIAIGLSAPTVQIGAALEPVPVHLIHDRTHQRGAAPE